MFSHSRISDFLSSLLHFALFQRAIVASISHLPNTYQGIDKMNLKEILSFAALFAVSTAYTFPNDLPNGNYSVFVSWYAMYSPRT